MLFERDELFSCRTRQKKSASLRPRRIQDIFSYFILLIDRNLSPGFCVTLLIECTERSILMPGEKRSTTLRFLAEPSDVNFGGKVHGGSVMKWIDLAAYGCAAAWSGQYCITAYVGGMHFVAPVLVGNMVEVSAKVIYTGRTSMHLGVQVLASDPKSLKKALTTHCVVVMVAMDENGKPHPVPEWIPKSEKDIAERNSAIRLMNMRSEISEEMQRFVKAPKSD